MINHRTSMPITHETTLADIQKLAQHITADPTTVSIHIKHHPYINQFEPRHTQLILEWSTDD